MKKVYQRNINAGDGDCMKCAIATLIGLNYDDVPHFLKFESPNSEYSTIADLQKCSGINGLFYASVFSPKYYKEEDGFEGYQITHAVLINKNYEIVFDPNPNYKDLKKYPASEQLGYNGIKTVYLFAPKLILKP